MNFAQEKAVQNLEDLFYLLGRKSGQIFRFPQRFLTVEYLEEYWIFSHGKISGYFKFSNEVFRLQKARRTLQFCNEFPTNFSSGESGVVSCVRISNKQIKDGCNCRI
jgi:hypothetical protein